MDFLRKFSLVTNYFVTAYFEAYKQNQSIKTVSGRFKDLVYMKDK